jgi:two-component system response regulator VanR
MKSRILLVEDEIQISELLSEILSNNNYEVDVANDGVEGYSLFKKNEYSLVITDVMMPNLNGHELVKLIRENNDVVPIIMLTALGDEVDEIKGFDMGINDYIKKPFSYNILLKRVESLIVVNKNNSILEAVEIVMDLDAHTVTFKGESVDLTVKEFAILQYLMENKNRVISRDQLLEHAWGTNYFTDKRNVDTHMKNIRKKIPVKNIKTVKGVGYNFVI